MFAMNKLLHSGLLTLTHSPTGLLRPRSLSLSQGMEGDLREGCLATVRKISWASAWLCVSQDQGGPWRLVGAGGHRNGEWASGCPQEGVPHPREELPFGLQLSLPSSLLAFPTPFPLSGSCPSVKPRPTSSEAASFRSLF